MSTTYRACVIKADQSKVLWIESLVRGLQPVRGSVSHSDDYRELIFRVEEHPDTLLKLQQWLNEQHQPPFPTGALLAFSEAQDA